MPNRRELIGTIAEALWRVNANRLPEICTRLGLEPGTTDEAMSSKRAYVKKRLSKLDDDTLKKVGQELLKDYGTLALKKTLDLLQADAEHRITALTRNAILDELILRGGLEGKLSLTDFLIRTWPLRDMRSTDARFQDAAGDIWQHMINNNDWDENYLYREYLGTTTLPDSEFINFLEQVVHPLVRQGQEQEQYVTTINKHLARDGYSLSITRHVSGYPEYRAIQIGGVRKPVKNIIFASTGPKPEIVLRDSVSNDIEIVKNKEFCLVYERPIAHEGLLWKDLVSWWASTESLEEGAEETERDLYLRLAKSLASDPERTLFKTYYALYHDLLGERLPALVPQVYLHYDPYTIRITQGKRRLLRQRMDFLLLLAGARRAVIEIDGKHHYADDGIASPKLYAEMVSEDRKLTLAGYEMYRFGGNEFTSNEHEVRELLKSFFDTLFMKHGVTLHLKQEP